MLQIRSIHRLDQIEIALRLAAERHGGSILAISRVSDVMVKFFNRHLGKRI